jgi:hypothetical protein
MLAILASKNMTEITQDANNLQADEFHSLREQPKNEYWIISPCDFYTSPIAS